MKISLLDAQHTIYEGVVSEATLPAIGGELTLMDDHEAIFVALAKGSIRLKPLVQIAGVARYGQDGRAGREIRPIFIRQGLARLKNNELVILVE
jgi:F0F1-type ATP synthase epsilon subunit